MRTRKKQPRRGVSAAGEEAGPVVCRRVVQTSVVDTGRRKREKKCSEIKALVVHQGRPGGGGGGEARVGIRWQCSVRAKAYIGYEDFWDVLARKKNMVWSLLVTGGWKVWRS